MKCTDNRFYTCKHCGNFVGMIFQSGVPMICCGEEMTEVVPNATEAAHEKHLPVIRVQGDTVTVEVGSAPHPMIETHYIQWIYLQTKRGGQRKCLQPGEKPAATFTLVDDEAIGAYEYCNLHGLWKTEV